MSNLDEALDVIEALAWEDDCGGHPYCGCPYADDLRAVIAKLRVGEHVDIEDGNDDA